MSERIQKMIDKAFDKMYPAWVVQPTSHDEAKIKRLMQQMYDAGHADGYAARFYDEQEEKASAEVVEQLRIKWQ